MKTLRLTLLASLLIGCQAAPFRFSGGDGSSMESAVIIRGARDEEAGVAAERTWLEQRYPGFHQGQQSLLGSKGKNYDEIKITTQEGAKTVYFDITDFFGK